MINIKSFYLKDIPHRGLILIGKGEDGNDYCFRDAAYRLQLIPPVYVNPLNLNTILTRVDYFPLIFLRFPEPSPMNPL